jgi:hypothetical protein
MTLAEMLNRGPLQQQRVGVNTVPEGDDYSDIARSLLNDWAVGHAGVSAEDKFDSLLGRSYQPSQEFIDWSKGGSSDPDVAEAKMNSRERIKAMLDLMRRNAEQSYGRTETLPIEMMEQRNIDPRDYGAALPPDAPLFPMRSQDREWDRYKANMGRWEDQLSQRKGDRRYDFDREKWIDPAPPQLTGRFRNRIAF